MKQVFIAAIALAAGLAGAGAPAQAPIRVGFMSPLTGGQAAMGIDNRDGALLALHELNRQGIRVGGQVLRFALDAHDDGADARQGVQVAQMLVDRQVRFVLGPYDSGVALPASRVFAQAGSVVLTVASNPKVTQQGHRNLFRIGASDDQLGAAMAAYAARDLKVRSVAVIDDQTAYGRGVASRFADEAKRLGVKVVASEFTIGQATDFSAILTRVRASRADALFFGGYSAQAGPMLRQMRALGLRMPLLGGDALCSAETATLAQVGGDLNTYCSRGGSMIDWNAQGQAFAQRFQAAYQRPPLTYAAAFYDGMKLLAAAIEATQSTDPARVVDYLSTHRYVGVAGAYAYDAKHDLRSSAVTVFTFRNGQPQPLKSL